MSASSPQAVQLGTFQPRSNKRHAYWKMHDIKKPQLSWTNQQICFKKTWRQTNFRRFKSFKSPCFGGPPKTTLVRHFLSRALGREAQRYETWAQGKAPALSLKMAMTNYPPHGSKWQVSCKNDDKWSTVAYSQSFVSHDFFLFVKAKRLSGRLR